MSPSRTGPLTLRMMDRLDSSRNSTRTWVHCPWEPVRPRILVTRANLTLSMLNREVGGWFVARKKQFTEAWSSYHEQEMDRQEGKQMELPHGPTERAPLSDRGRLDRATGARDGAATLRTRFWTTGSSKWSRALLGTASGLVTAGQRVQIVERMWGKGEKSLPVPWQDKESSEAIGTRDETICLSGEMALTLVHTIWGTNNNTNQHNSKDCNQFYFKKCHWRQRGWRDGPFLPRTLGPRPRSSLSNTLKGAN